MMGQTQITQTAVEAASHLPARFVTPTETITDPVSRFRAAIAFINHAGTSLLLDQWGTHKTPKTDTEKEKLIEKIIQKFFKITKPTLNPIPLQTYQDAWSSFNRRQGNDYNADLKDFKIIISYVFQQGWIIKQLTEPETDISYNEFVKTYTNAYLKVLGERFRTYLG